MSWKSPALTVNLFLFMGSPRLGSWSGLTTER